MVVPDGLVELAAAEVGSDGCAISPIGVLLERPKRISEVGNRCQTLRVVIRVAKIEQSIDCARQFAVRMPSGVIARVLNQFVAVHSDLGMPFADQKPAMVVVEAST